MAPRSIDCAKCRIPAKEHGDDEHETTHEYDPNYDVWWVALNLVHDI